MSADNFDKFLAADCGKRERIIGAAMREFLAGYKRASTDNIVREAGISKGLLFHYFGTKEGLYRYLVEYSVKIIEEEFLGLLNVHHKDILDAAWQMSLLKRDVSQKYPAIFDFLTAAYLDTDARTAETKDMLEKGFETRNRILGQIYGNADYSGFKDNISPERAIKIMGWVMNGYAEEAAGTDTGVLPAGVIRENYGKFLEEFKEYLDILRECFYKKEDGK